MPSVIAVISIPCMDRLMRCLGGKCANNLSLPKNRSPEHCFRMGYHCPELKWHTHSIYCAGMIIFPMCIYIPHCIFNPSTAMPSPF